MNTDFCNLHDTGIVTKKNLGGYSVRLEGQTLLCSPPIIFQDQLRDQTEMSGQVLESELPAHRERGRRSERDGGRPNGRPDRRRPAETSYRHSAADLIAVGDHVRIAPTEPGRGMILEVLPRKSKLARKSAVPMPTARPHEQVIVANVDQVVPVFAAAAPPPKWGLLDRYLVSAEAANLPALVCLTKADLALDSDGLLEPDLQAVVDEYRRIGYPVVLTSALTGRGLGELRAALAGRTSVFLGKSGVGKTSLLNALQPGLGLRVREVSQVTGKGKHTTTALEMFSLSSDGEPWTAIVDTPGVREFGLWELEERDLASFFPEMRSYLGRCRFGLDCAHEEEPGCAIRRAVTAGEISPLRYASYLRLRVDA